jgi:hypothetical protein
LLELLLNFLWLMLLLPAAWIWQRRQEQAAPKSVGSLRGFRSFVLLGFIVVLLFPIISISDDLHPMRADVEESSPSKKIAKQLTAVKNPAWNQHSAPPAQIVALFSLQFSQTASEIIPPYVQILPLQIHVSTIGSRAPPDC